MLSRSLVFVLLLVCAVRAQAPTSSASSASSTEAAASILLDTASYSYIGCYNETTKNPSVGNTRALAGGNMVRLLNAIFDRHASSISLPED